MVIYTPKGLALDYAKHALTIYNNCRNGCKYCFVPKFTQTEPAVFHQAPTPRKDLLKLVEKDLIKMQKENDIERTLLSFMSDCYPEEEEELRLTRGVIELFIKYERPFTILSKAGWRSTEDFDLMKERPDLCSYGASLVFLYDKDALKYEPFAASTTERMNALHFAHELGIPTWASLEPAWDFPNVKGLILSIRDYVDEVKIGKLNYHPHAQDVNWHEFKANTVAFCDRWNINYTLKSSLINL